MKEDRRKKLEVLSWNEEVRAEPPEFGNDEDGVKLGGWFWMTKKSYRSPDTDGRTHEKPGGLLWMSRDDAASS